MKHKVDLPLYFGKVVEERLKVLERNTKYDAYTLNDKLEIELCEGIIKNNRSWNYHNNYDDSEDVLVANGFQQWWTLSKSEIKKIQKEHLDKAIKTLSKELERLKSLY